MLWWISGVSVQKGMQNVNSSHCVQEDRIRERLPEGILSFTGKKAASICTST